VSAVTDAIDATPDGPQQLRAMITGDRQAPMAQTLGFRLTEAEHGRVVFEGLPDRSV
jgi:hypothetical protein